MNQFERRLAFEQLLDALRILNAGHLHQNLVRALRAVSLHQRLSDADCIQAAFNDSLACSVACSASARWAVGVSVQVIVLPLVDEVQSVKFDLLLDGFFDLAQLGRIRSFENDPIVAGSRFRLHILDWKSGVLRSILSGERSYLPSASSRNSSVFTRITRCDPPLDRDPDECSTPELALIPDQVKSLKRGLRRGPMTI